MGISVAVSKRKANRIGMSLDSPPALANIHKSNPRKAAHSDNTIQKLIDQISTKRAAATERTRINIPGISNAIQNKCIEANAFDSGSQPQSPQKKSIWGRSSFEICNAPAISATHIAMEMTGRPEDDFFKATFNFDACCSKGAKSKIAMRHDPPSSNLLETAFQYEHHPITASDPSKAPHYKEKMLDSHEILGPGKLIAKRLENYEHREQQLEMADAVAQAIAEKQHLVVEAGTGVGKSFGYLVPAILSLEENQKSNEAKKRIVVSTHTISLQEQLLTKDIPLLNSVIPLEFSAILAKGRGNYISLRRLRRALENKDSLFSSVDEHDQLQSLRVWAHQTRDGSKSDMDFRLLSSVWEEVQSDSSNCLGKTCPMHAECHYFKARKRLHNADILIVNHALFFSDLALRRLGVNILPDYHTVILDEAHTIQDVASDHLGIRVTLGQVEYTLNRLFNRNNKGLLATHSIAGSIQALQRCQHACDLFFGDILEWIERNASSGQRQSNIRIKQKEIVANPLSPALTQLGDLIRRYGLNRDNPSDKQDLLSASERLDVLASAIENWRIQDMDDEGVYWIESGYNRRQRQTVALEAAPLDVGPALRDSLFSKVDSVIMTSATIAVGKEGFDFFQNRVGLTQCRSLKLGSPFNYNEQARIVVVPNMISPVEHRDTHERQCIEAIQHFVARTDGHAFVLFTSYEFMNRAVSELTPWLTDRQFGLYVQGTGTTRAQLIEKFKQNPRSVLFGTDSFWQGVDVQGDALQNVIITKLPFSVPGQAAASGAPGLHSRTGRKPVSGLSVARSDHQIQAGIRPLDSQQARFGHRGRAGPENQNQTIRTAVYRQSARMPDRDRVGLIWRVLRTHFFPAVGFRRDSLKHEPKQAAENMQRAPKEKSQPVTGWLN